MTVFETDLPGVGKKFEVPLDDGTTLVVVIHNTGKRELFHRPTAEADAEKLFELSDRQARELGTIIEGAYFQPIRTEAVRTVLGDDTLLEWVTVSASAAVANTTIADAQLRSRTGASVLAIQRGEETEPNPDPDSRIEAGDTLIVMGSREAVSAVTELAEAVDADS